MMYTVEFSYNDLGEPGWAVIDAEGSEVYWSDILDEACFEADELRCESDD